MSTPPSSSGDRPSRPTVRDSSQAPATRSRTRERNRTTTSSPASANAVASGGGSGVGGNGALTTSQKATMVVALALGGLVLIAGVLAWRSSRNPSSKPKKKKSRKSAASASSALSSSSPARSSAGGPRGSPVAARSSPAGGAGAGGPGGGMLMARSARPVPKSRKELALSIKDEANLLYKDKDYVGAIRKYSDALRYADNDGETSSKILGNRVLAFIQLKDFAKAYDDSNEMVKFDPKNARAYQLRGISLQELEKFESAAKDLRKAFELYPDGGKMREKCLERLMGLEAILVKHSQPAADVVGAMPAAAADDASQTQSASAPTQNRSENVDVPNDEKTQNDGANRDSTPPYKVLERPGSGSSPASSQEPDIPYKKMNFSDTRVTTESNEVATTTGTNDGAAPVAVGSVSSEKLVKTEDKEDDVIEIAAETSEKEEIIAAEPSMSASSSSGVESNRSEKPIDLTIVGQKVYGSPGDQQQSDDDEEPLVDEPSSSSDDARTPSASASASPSASSIKVETADLGQSSLLSRSDVNWEVVDTNTDTSITNVSTAEAAAETVTDTDKKVDTITAAEAEGSALSNKVGAEVDANTDAVPASSAAATDVVATSSVAAAGSVGTDLGTYTHAATDARARADVSAPPSRSGGGNDDSIDRKENENIENYFPTAATASSSLKDDASEDGSQAAQDVAHDSVNEIKEGSTGTSTSSSVSNDYNSSAAAEEGIVDSTTRESGSY